jgi:drug/metabolite transporter (DMT)-like permease
VTRGAAHVVLLVALVLVSTSGPFLTMARMDAFAVVFWRCALSAPLFFAWAAARGELSVARRDLGPMVLGALLLTAHWCAWIKAFDLTDYASNLLLLVAQPIIAAFLGIRLGERPTRATWISITLALVGLAVIAGGDFALGPRALFGDALCIAGGFGITLFYVVTREVRARTSLATFMGVTMGAGALASLPVAIGAGGPLLPEGAASWLWLAGLVVLTTALGHGFMNLAARHVRLFALNVVIVLEPVLGILMGALLFPVDVRPLQLAGGALLAIAVWIGVRDR